VFLAVREMAELAPGDVDTLYPLFTAGKKLVHCGFQGKRGSVVARPGRSDCSRLEGWLSSGRFLPAGGVLDRVVATFKTNPSFSP